MRLKIPRNIQISNNQDMAKYTNIQHSGNCGIEIQIRLNPKIILIYGP